MHPNIYTTIWKANALGNDFESFERLIIQLDYNLMSSRSFISTIEQNFDPNGRFQAANYNLYLEIYSMINSLYGQYCERINTENKTSEQLDCVGVYAMYVLYRRCGIRRVVHNSVVAYLMTVTNRDGEADSHRKAGRWPSVEN